MYASPFKWRGRALLSPKSPTFSVPWRHNKRLAGFKSRWITGGLQLWRKVRACAKSIPQRAQFLRGTRAPFLGCRDLRAQTYSSRLPPSMYSLSRDTLSVPMHAPRNRTARSLYITRFGLAVFGLVQAVMHRHTKSAVMHRHTPKKKTWHRKHGTPIYIYVYIREIRGTLAECEWRAAAPELKPLRLPCAPSHIMTCTCTSNAA